MNDDFADLETELRALQPLRHSRALEERLGQALAATMAAAPAAPAIFWWQKLGFQRPLAAFTWGLATPAAAVCAILLLQAGGVLTGARFPAPAARPVSTPSMETASSGFEPATTSNVVYQTSDEGVVSDAQQQPARQVRYLSHETLAWHNPRTGAQVEVSYPREEVVLTPISLR